jgi:hypothetical protein
MSLEMWNAVMSRMDEQDRFIKEGQDRLRQEVLNLHKKECI